MHSPEIQELTKYLAKIPGLGPRSGRRAVLHLIKNRDTLLQGLLQALTQVNEKITTCLMCGNLDTCTPCHICTDLNRDRHVICVIEDVIDLWAIERTNYYKGLYFCLGGTLSAIQGITPDDLRIPFFIRHLQSLDIQEVILALNANMDGQATTFYLGDILDPLNIKVSSLAQGVPLGGELDYLDDGTLMTALQARRPLSA